MDSSDKGASVYAAKYYTVDSNGNATELTGGSGGSGSDGADGADGADGKGWTGGSYDSSTGVVTFTSNDGLGFTTGDLRGATGATGAAGAAGAAGADGADGAAGATGAQGPKGDKGDKGDTGESGVAGAVNDMTDGYKDTSNLVVGEVSSNLTFESAGVKNTIIGVNDWTDTNITTGYNNTAIGFNSGKKITTGRWNTLIGTSTGQFLVGGNSNVFIGNNTGVIAANAGSQNRIAIGAGITHQLGNNIAVIGNATVTKVYMAYDGEAEIYANATINSSDLRLKSFIKPVNLGLSFINELNPVSYLKMSRSQYKGDDSSGEMRYEYGLLAQEVDNLLKEADPENSVITKDNDGLLGMDYKQLIMPLIKSVQELSDEVDRLKKEIEELKK